MSSVGVGIENVSVVYTLHAPAHIWKQRRAPSNTSRHYAFSGFGAASRTLTDIVRGFICEEVIRLNITRRHQTLLTLQTIASLLSHVTHLHDTVTASRLARAVLPRLAVLLSKRSQVDTQDEQIRAPAKSKKGKKRAREYEGDEALKVGQEIVCSTAEEGCVLLAATGCADPLFLV